MNFRWALNHIDRQDGRRSGAQDMARDSTVYEVAREERLEVVSLLGLDCK
jgi:hypothetical protein